MMQKDAFLASEGDAWAERNYSMLAPSTGQLRQVEALAPYIGSNPRVLEIGCSYGRQSHLLAKRIGSGTYFGLDPSRQAVDKGRADYPELILEVGTAEALPYESSAFEAVWFAFCLYLVDRPLLHRVVAEADRVLADGGTLAITDFDPPAPSKRPYRHRNGMFSYKMDHSRLFLADPAYVLVEKIPLGVTGAKFESEPSARVALWILRKQASSAYALEMEA